MPPKVHVPFLMIALALAACEPSAGEMGTLTGPMPQTPPPIAVHEQQRQLAVDLSGGIIADPDWVRIDGFLIDAAAGRPEMAHLVIATKTPVAAVTHMVRHALAAGYTDANIAMARSASDGGARRPHLKPGLTLTVRTFVAVLPNCPQTEHLNVIDGDNIVSSDWGCATVSTLGLQVEDPRDLVLGRGGGQTNSVMTTAAIRRLEADKLKKLDTIGTTSSEKGASQ